MVNFFLHLPHKLNMLVNFFFSVAEKMATDSLKIVILSNQLLQTVIESTICFRYFNIRKRILSWQRSCTTKVFDEADFMFHFLTKSPICMDYRCCTIYFCILKQDLKQLFMI